MGGGVPFRAGIRQGSVFCFYKQRGGIAGAKKKALAKSVNRNMLKLSELQRYLENLEQRDFLDLLNGSRIILEQTPGNEALLDAFQKRNWIVGFEVDQQDDSLYRAQGKAVLGRKRKKR